MRRVTPTDANRPLTAAGLAAIATACLLAACRAAAPVAPPPPVDTPTAAIDRGSAEEYVIDTAASSVTLLVYRAGALARLGHNHVIESRDLAGRVWLEDRSGRSAFELRMPVETLIVDDPGARAEAGDDFPGEIPAADIVGTRANMLGERLLHAAAYPEIVIRSDAVDAGAGRLEVPVTLVVKGESRRLRFPLMVTRTGGRLTARGETTTSHAKLGLEPFSVMMGALSVAEEIDVRYHIEAIPADSR